MASRATSIEVERWKAISLDTLVAYNDKETLMINEFAGNQFTCVYEDGSPADVCLDGDAYLQRLNFDDDTIALSCVLLMVIAVAFNAVAYGVLVARRPHFQKLDTPSPTSVEGPISILEAAA